jgi:hypothetical protein
MAKIKYYRKWKFGGIDYYRLAHWYVWVGAFGLEVQVNKWPSR